jgi:flagellar biosynthetic protein FlhB
MASEKTEKATPKRREDARKKGQIARGPKLPAAAGFFAALLVMRMTGSDWLYHAGHSFASLSSQIGSGKALTSAAVYETVLGAGWSFALLILPVLSAVFVAVIAGNFVQGGFQFTPKALVPKAERFNPVAHLKRMYVEKGLVVVLEFVFGRGIIFLE